MIIRNLKELGILNLFQTYVLKDLETDQQIDYAYGDEEVVEIGVDAESFMPVIYLKGANK